jgi:hypothetical protein
VPARTSALTLTRERDEAVALLGDVERLIAEREEALAALGRHLDMEARNAGPPMWRPPLPPDNYDATEAPNG